MQNFFSRQYTNKAITLYVLSLASVSLLFANYALWWFWMVFGLFQVYLFFHFSNKLTYRWSRFSPVYFEKKLFRTSLLIRIIYIIFSYFFFLEMTGKPFEFGESLDSLPYHEEGVWVAQLIKQGNLSPYFSYISGQGSFSDMGYPFFLGILNWISGNSILFARLFNALFDSVTVLLVYRIARRHFGDEPARIAGILYMILPTAIFYSGLHMKESFMIMLMMAFLQRADLSVSSRHYSTWNIFLMSATLALLFFFRTVLGVISFLSLGVALLIGTRTFVSLGRRIKIAFLAVTVSLFVLGSIIFKEVDTLWLGKSIKQTGNLQYRAERQGGNTYAKYLTGAVFVPVIFVIPFPTMVDIPEQENLKMIHGGYYIKNILSFFTLLAFLLLLKNGTWRQHVFPLAMIVGYHMALALSSFAQSGRFHMLSMPLLVMFASFGISKISIKQWKFFNWFLIAEFLVIIAWSWFKLAGRGLI